MQGFPATVVLAVLAVLCFLTWGAAASASTIVTLSPAEPLLDVPFLATPALSTDATLYVSTSSSCAADGRVSSVCTIGGTSLSSYNSTTCEFTITSSSVGINPFYETTMPTLYWCSSAYADASLGLLSMNTIQPTPQFLFAQATGTLTFNSATPVGTEIGFYNTSTCTTFVAGVNGPVVLGATREAVLTMPTSGNIVYTCARVPTFSGTTTGAIRAAAVYKGVDYTIGVTEGLRFTSVNQVADATFSWFSLSASPSCVPLAQSASTVSAGSGVTLPITVRRGEYYFCALITPSTALGSGAYIPASNTFRVKEFGIQPHRMYAGLATSMTLTMDAVEAGHTFEAGLFTTSACTTAVIPWSTSLSWTVPNAGTYYACVRDQANPSTTTSHVAAPIRVTTPPTLSFSRNPGIRGLGLTTTISRGPNTNSVLTVGLASDNKCTPLLTEGDTTTTSSTVDFVVPVSSPALAYYCVSSPQVQAADSTEEPDVPYFYPLGTLTLRAYDLTYPPLLVNTSMAITLDSTVTFASGTSMTLMPVSGGGCSGTPSADNTNQFQLSSSTVSLTPVRFAEAGDWELCVREPSIMSGEPVALRTLRVYGNATLNPAGLVAGLASTITVTNIPPNMPVYLTTSPVCSADATKLASATSNANSAATLTNVRYATEATLLVCVGYAGEANGAPTETVVHPAGNVRVAGAHVFPAVAIVNVNNQMRLQVPDPRLLINGLAYLISTTATCTSTAPSTSVQSPIRGDSVTMPYFSFTPRAATLGDEYQVCVGSTGSFVSAGTLTVVEAMNVQSSPADVGKGLPVSLTFSGNAFVAISPNRYAVISDADECTMDLSTVHVYASGAIASSGVADAFIAPTTLDKLIVCVASDSMLLSDTLGYMTGATLDAHDFTALSQYAQLGKTNDLHAWPVVSGGSLFLAPCTGTACTPAQASTTCQTASTTYVTTGFQALEGAPLGTYVLCQRATNPVAVVVGANTTVTVITPWTMSTSATEIRQHVPFTVTLSGGPTSTTRAASGSAAVRVQPASVPCNETASSGNYQDLTVNTGGVPTSLTVTSPPPQQKIVFCVRASPYDQFEVMQSTLLFYMAPATIIADTPTTIRSALLRDHALSKIASRADCADTISTGNPQTITDYTSTLTVAGCGVNANVLTAYYCESQDGGATYTQRGAMGLLRRTGCAGGAPASIAAVTVPPAQAITDFGITTSYLVSPYVSTTSDCRATISNEVNSVGYTPAYDSTGALYVCAATIDDPNTIFTTASPTLTVDHFVVTPLSALSRLNASAGTLPRTTMTINYRTASTQTFFSRASNCATTLAAASGFGSTSLTAVYSSTAISGLVYVCTADTISTGTVAIASFLSLTPPSITSISMAVIRGAPFSATLVVPSAGGQGPLYSMVPGADASNPYASSFTSTARDVFLSTDSCQTVLAGTTSTTVTASSNAVSFDTTNIAHSVSKASLCTSTPAGVAESVSSIPVAPGNVYPYQFVTGVVSPIYIPLYPATQVFLSQSNNDCTAVVDSASPFTTDADGYASMSLFYTNTRQALPIGVYTLCYSQNPSELTALGTIELFEPVHFGVRGQTYVVGVPATMTLLQDLRSSYLQQGFSTTKDCAAPDTTYGSWLADTDTSIVVTATSARQNLYLCADAPINGTRCPLPDDSTGLLFAVSAVVPPTGGYDTCNSLSLNQCYYPGTNGGVPTTDMNVGVVYGDCCNPVTRSSNLLGSTPMTGDGVCKLQLSHNKAIQYPAKTDFNLCMWSTSNPQICSAVSQLQVNTTCKANAVSGGGSKLSKGALIAIIILSILAGLALIALIIWLIWYCCCRKAQAKEVDERQLVALRQVEGGDYEFGPDYLGASAHPLLYYPTSSVAITGDEEQTVSRSRSTSAQSSTPQGLLEAIEDDERDQIALEEARERYALRLGFTEALERLRLQEKDDDVDVGYEDVDDHMPVGQARPEVMEIDVDPSTLPCDTTNDHILESDSEDDEELMGHMMPQEMRRVSSRSIVSSRASTPTGRESTFTNEDAEEQEEICIDEEDAAPEDGEDTPRRPRVLVPKAVRASPADKATRDASPHIDPMSRCVPDDHLHAPPTDGQNTTGSMPDASSIVDASPINHDPADAVSAPQSFIPAMPQFSPASEFAGDSPAGNRTAPGAPANPEEAPEDEPEEDELSFTTTQRFYDEKLFLLQQEDTRRQRLSNWEEEDRATLSQQELEEYMELTKTERAGSGEAPTVAEEAEEEEYEAPAIPADLPPLPAAPPATRTAADDGAPEVTAMGAVHPVTPPREGKETRYGGRPENAARSLLNDTDEL